jgi:hypothetical protein
MVVNGMQILSGGRIPLTQNKRDVALLAYSWDEITNAPYVKDFIAIFDIEIKCNISRERRFALSQFSIALVFNYPLEKFWVENARSFRRPNVPSTIITSHWGTTGLPLRAEFRTQQTTSLKCMQWRGINLD